MTKKVTLKGYTIVYRGECIKNPLNGRPGKAPDSHWHKLPVPDNDGIYTCSVEFNWWCGCTRKTDLFKWWKKNEFKEHPKNFKVRVLAVPNHLVIKGDTQCIFDRRKAKVIGTVNPDGSLCLQNNKLQQYSKTKKVTS